MNAYSKASFEAAKEAAKKYLDAAVKQVVDTIIMEISSLAMRPLR